MVGDEGIELFRALGNVVDCGVRKLIQRRGDGRTVDRIGDFLDSGTILNARVVDVGCNDFWGSVLLLVGASWWVAYEKDRGVDCHSLCGAGGTGGGGR